MRIPSSLEMISWYSVFSNKCFRLFIAIVPVFKSHIRYNNDFQDKIKGF
jgi:hypothetical protein